MPASPSPAPWLKLPLGPGVSLSGRSFPAPPELTCHRPDGERGVAGVPPVFRGADVHAPQLPAVPVGGVLVALHFEVVLLDVVDGGEDDPLPVFLDAGKDRLGPAKAEKSPSNSVSWGARVSQQASKTAPNEDKPKAGTGKETEVLKACDCREFEYVAAMTVSRFGFQFVLSQASTYPSLASKAV